MYHDEIKEGLWISIGALCIFCALLLVTLGVSSRENTLLKKELAEITIARTQSAGETNKTRTSCFQMMKDPVIHKIMCGKNHI
jgi:hypothetical protein